MNRLVVVKKSKSYKTNRIFPIITILGLGLIIWALLSMSLQSRFEIPIEFTATLATSTEVVKGSHPDFTQEVLSDAQPKVNEVRPEVGDFIGTITMPAINRSLPIYEGTTEDQLSIGAGHVVTSVLPGWMDNSVIAGHRRTTFKNVGKLVIDDLIIIESKHGVFTYKIVKIRIVESDDETVIVSTKKATLTLVTCYPFTSVFYPTQRYIIIAELIHN